MSSTCTSTARPSPESFADVRYQRGQYLNAMNQTSAELNEQNIVTVEGDGPDGSIQTDCGLLARRIVFYPKVGDRLERGQRVGLIKFGSRVDVLLDASARINVKVGDHVRVVPASSPTFNRKVHSPPQTALPLRGLIDGSIFDGSSSKGSVPGKRRRLSKGMYIIPSLFTTANMALGYYAILEVMHATTTISSISTTRPSRSDSPSCSTGSTVALRA